MESYGYGGRVALVDLTAGRVTTEPTDEYPIEAVLGGRGLAHMLLQAHLPARVDPLGPTNVLVFAPGALVGSHVPSAGRWSVATKSPLTHLLGSGNAGGSWGLALKWAGFDALVVKGQANAPCYLHVRDGEIEICSADEVWGLDTREVVTALRAAHQDPQLQVAAIGMAGERLAPIANIIAEERAAGRGGIGAVMGSKRLKAIAIHGDRGIRIAEPQRLNDLVATAVEELRLQKFFASYRRYGSSGAVRDRYGTLGGLLPYNGQQGEYPHLERVNGQVLADGYLLRSRACPGCPVGCLKVFAVRNGPYAGTWGEGVQTATMIGFGARCVMTDLAAVLRAHALVNLYGLDLISTEAIIAFAIECYQKGIIGPEDTGGLALSWENDAAVLRLTELMGRREGIGDLLVLGVRQLGRRWGPAAEGAALHVKGLELTAVDARAFPAWALMYAVSSRGADHMRAYCLTEFGEFPDEVVARMSGTPEAVQRFGVEGKGRLVACFEDLRAMADCLGLCKFVARGNYMFPERLVDLVRATLGRRLEAEELRLVGERVVHWERLFNLREGLRPADDTLPPRMLQEPIRGGPVDGHVANLTPMLNEYYSVRDWDPTSGWPSEGKLRQLALSRRGEYTH